MLRNDPSNRRKIVCTSVGGVLAALILTAIPDASGQNPLAHSGTQRSPGCLPRGTRTRESCDPKQVVVQSEGELEVLLELPPRLLAQCEATIEIAYTQRGSDVGVEGEIENEDCGASNGDYELLVSIRNASGEVKTLEFFESWRRQDDELVSFSRAYPIGENVDLLRVRAARLRCNCAEQAE